LPLGSADPDCSWAVDPELISDARDGVAAPALPVEWIKIQVEFCQKVTDCDPVVMKRYARRWFALILLFVPLLQATIYAQTNAEKQESVAAVNRGGRYRPR
jgi:hypothetical protein